MSGNFSNEIVIPIGSVFEHSVKSDEELSHACDLYHEIGFSGVFEPFGKVNKNGVTSSRRECGHIDCVSYIRSSACDASSSFEFSTVMVVRGQSTEGSDLSSIGGSEFGDFGEQLVCGGESNARYAGEYFRFRGPIVTGFEEFCDGDFDGCKLLVK